MLSVKFCGCKKTSFMIKYAVIPESRIRQYEPFMHMRKRFTIRIGGIYGSLQLQRNKRPAYEAWFHVFKITWAEFHHK